MNRLVSQPSVIKDYDKLDVSFQERIRMAFPLGFEDHLVKFTDRAGNKVSALPFDGDAQHFLIRMTIEQAQYLFADDEEEQEEEIENDLSTNPEEQLD